LSCVAALGSLRYMKFDLLPFYSVRHNKEHCTICMCSRGFHILIQNMTKTSKDNGNLLYTIVQLPQYSTGASLKLHDMSAYALPHVDVCSMILKFIFAN
jgi:hypothetical protein